MGKFQHYNDLFNVSYQDSNGKEIGNKEHIVTINPPSPISATPWNTVNDRLAINRITSFSDAIPSTTIEFNTSRITFHELALINMNTGRPNPQGPALQFFTFVPRPNSVTGDFTIAQTFIVW